MNGLVKISYYLFSSLLHTRSDVYKVPKEEGARMTWTYFNMKHEVVGRAIYKKGRDPEFWSVKA